MNRDPALWEVADRARRMSDWTFLLCLSPLVGYVLLVVVLVALAEWWR